MYTEMDRYADAISRSDEIQQLVNRYVRDMTDLLRADPDRILEPLQQSADWYAEHLPDIPHDNPFYERLLADQLANAEAMQYVANAINEINSTGKDDE